MCGLLSFMIEKVRWKAYDLCPTGHDTGHHYGDHGNGYHTGDQHFRHDAALDHLTFLVVLSHGTGDLGGDNQRAGEAEQRRDAEGAAEIPALVEDLAHQNGYQPAAGQTDEIDDQQGLYHAEDHSGGVVPARFITTLTISG